MSSRQTLAPSAATLEQMAEEAIARLPELFRTHLEGVVVRVEEFADPALIEEMELGSPYDLTGLYQGRPIGEKSSLDSGALPDMITLYRQPLLLEWAETGVSLEALITHVVVHEAGHHFGFSDEDMHAIEDAAG